jgi:peptidoglycan/xylan/chitin deacetylase (PgdA/CDA1 family)
MKKFCFFISIITVWFMMFVGSSFAAGMVTFTFDDGMENVYTNAFPILSQHNLPATVGVISDYIDMSGYLTAQQLRDLHDAGWEMASHSIDHIRLTTLGTCEARAELFESKYVINEVLGGFYVTNFIAPYTAWSSSFDVLATDLYHSIILGGGSANTIPPGYWLYRYTIHTDTTVDQLTNYVTVNAIDQNRWVILMFHAIGDPDVYGWQPFSKLKLNDFCQWLNTHQVPVVTIEQGLNLAPPEPPTITEIPNTQMSLVGSDSEASASYEAAMAVDGNPNTFWHTPWGDGVTSHPHWMEVDLGQQYCVCGFRYLPRQDSSLNGTIENYEFYVSPDGFNWGSASATGTFTPANHSEKEVIIPCRYGRLVRLVALTEINGQPYTSMAELTVLAGNSCSLQLDPSASTLCSGGTVQFTATGAEGAVSFSVCENNSGGVIDGNGLYTAGTSCGVTDTICVSDAGQNSARSDVVVTCCNAPEITSLQPTSALSGETVSIIGNRFGDTQTAERYITFSNGQLAAVSSWTDTQIICIVPDGAQSGCVTVTSEEGISNCAEFTVEVPGCDPLDPLVYANITADSAAPSYAAALAVDGNPNTFWHTPWGEGAPSHPHWIEVDLDRQVCVCGFRYLPRQDSSLNGSIQDYEFHASADGITWGSAVAAGTLSSSDHSEKEVLVQECTSGRYLRLVAWSEVDGNPWTSMAELTILGQE